MHEEYKALSIYSGKETELTINQHFVESTLCSSVDSHSIGQPTYRGRSPIVK